MNGLIIFGLLLGLMLTGMPVSIALGLTVLFGILSGVYPAWRMSRLHPVQALKGASR